MSTDRRFTEEEIAAIFRSAAEAQRAAEDRPGSDKGLTLAELQKIGADAGISEEFVTRAAVEIGYRAGPGEQPETFLGIPSSASYSIEIPGPFTDNDWDRLVVDLRQTFKARGHISEDGSIREWRNGNLYALIEPMRGGVRLRLGSRRTEPKGMIAGGVGWFVFFLLLGVAKWADMGFDFSTKLVFLLIIAASGLVMAGVTATNLSKWSKERQHQMEAIAKRALGAGHGRRPVSAEGQEESATESNATSSPSRLAVPDNDEFESDSEGTRTRDQIRG